MKLEQPYHQHLTAGAVRELLAGHPDDTPVYLDGGDDWAHGHSIEVVPVRQAEVPA